MAISIKEKKEYLILVVILAAMILILYFYFILRPQATGLVRVFSKTKASRATLSKVQTDLKSIDELKDTIDAYKTKILYYEKKLPREQELPSLLESLSTIAKSNNVKLISVKPEKTVDDLKSQKDTLYVAIPISIKARCGYHQMARFINSLENSDRFMKIEDISVESDIDTPREHKVELVIYTYILTVKK